MTLNLIAVDPGMTTGLALLRITEAGLVISGTEATDPLRIVSGIWSLSRGVPNTVLLVEDFVGGGYRTAESNHTLKQIGLYEWTFSPYFPVILRTPQQRLKGTSLAKKLAQQPNVDIPEPHSLDALKHCFSYALEQGESFK